MIRSSLSLHRPLSFYMDLAEHQDYFEWETVDELPALIHLNRRLFVAGSVRWIVRGLDLR
jgi:hypothetical protein